MKKIIFLLLIPILFVACKSHNEIPFYEAKNYFVRNDIQNSVPVKFENEKDFKEYFGMAAVMGKDGMPTSIDFTKQYVIAVTLPETDTETDINLVSLKKDTNSDIILTYKDTKIQLFVLPAPRTYLKHSLHHLINPYIP